MLKNFLLVLICAFCCNIFADDVIDWGPFYRRLSTVDKEVVSCGPFYERSHDHKKGHSLLSVRPLFSFFGPDGIREENVDIIWPLGEKRVSSDRTKLRWLFFGATEKVDAVNAYKYYGSEWMFPLIWYKKEDGHEDSLVLGPFWGAINSGFTFTEADFVFFPLYAKSRTRDTVSKNWLWPIFNSSRGGGIRRYRFWPFYCYSRKENSGVNKSYLWPFIHTHKSLNKNMPGKGFFFFPFYGSTEYESLRRKNRISSRTVLWPFYTRYSSTFADKPEKNSHRRSFWPFYQESANYEGVNSHKKYWWPFYGKKVRDKFEYRFVMWPFWQAYDSYNGYSYKSRFLLPFYQYRERVDKDKVLEQTTRIWPLLRTHSDGKSSYRAFPALFPFHIDSIERNYAPFWTLYRAREGKEFSSFEVLWGLIYSRKSKDLTHWSFFPFVEYDHKVKKQEKKFSFLKGIFSCRKEKGKRFYRLLWLPEF